MGIAWCKTLSTGPNMVSDYFPFCIICNPITLRLTRFTHYAYLRWRRGHCIKQDRIVGDALGGIHRIGIRLMGSHAHGVLIGLKVADRDHILPSCIQAHGDAGLPIEQLQFISMEIHLSFQLLHCRPRQQEWGIALDHSGRHSSTLLRQTDGHCHYLWRLLTGTISIPENVLLMLELRLWNSGFCPQFSKRLQSIGTYDRLSTPRIQDSVSRRWNQHHRIDVHLRFRRKLGSQLFQ